MEEDKASKDVLDALTGHQRREQAKKEREEAQKQKESEIAAKEKNKNFMWITISIVLLVGFAIGIGVLMKYKPETYTDREVHWHAYIDLNVCGESIDLPCEIETSGTVHGQNFCGEHLMHHHYDNTIHIEGLIQKKEDIALGKFFDKIGVPFDSNKILNYSNGDLCNGKPGTWKMYVNDKPREDFRDYIPFATQDARKQIIKLAFEPSST